MAHEKTWEEWNKKLRGSPMANYNPGIEALCEYFNNLWAKEDNTITPLCELGDSHD